MACDKRKVQTAATQMGLPSAALPTNASTHIHHNHSHHPHPTTTLLPCTQMLRSTCGTIAAAIPHKPPTTSFPCTHVDFALPAYPANASTHANPANASTHAKPRTPAQWYMLPYRTPNTQHDIPSSRKTTGTRDPCVVTRASHPCSALPYQQGNAQHHCTNQKAGDICFAD